MLKDWHTTDTARRFAVHAAFCRVATINIRKSKKTFLRFLHREGIGMSDTLWRLAHHAWLALNAADQPAFAKSKLAQELFWRDMTAFDKAWAARSRDRRG